MLSPRHLILIHGFILLNLAHSAVSAEPAPIVPEPDAYLGCVGRRCYTVFAENTQSWSYANFTCRSFSNKTHVYSLATVDNEETFTFLNSYLATVPNDQREAWIGATENQYDKWKWLNGKTYNGTKAVRHYVVPDGRKPYCGLIKAQSLDVDVAGALCYDKKSYFCTAAPVTSISQFLEVIEDPTLSYISGVDDPTLTWFEAKKTCLARGMDLAVLIGTIADNAYNYMRTKEYFREFWVGLRRSEWTWESSGERLGYSKFGTSQPDYIGQTCLILNYGSGFNDLGCNTVKPFICQYSMVNDTGTTEEKLELVLEPTADLGCIGNRCIKYYGAIQTWDYARYMCRGLSTPDFRSRMVSVPDQETLDRLQLHLSTQTSVSSVWIGGRETQYDKWAWINGDIYNEIPVIEYYIGGDKPFCGTINSGQPFYEIGGSVCYEKKRYFCTIKPINSTSMFVNFVSSEENLVYISKPEERLTWFESRKICLDMGMELAVVTDNISQAAYNYFRNEKMNQFEFWIGLRKSAWIWDATGAEAKFTSFAPKEPNTRTEQCLMLAKNMGFYDLNCDERRTFFCEIRNVTDLERELAGGDGTDKSSSSGGIKLTPIIIGSVVAAVLVLLIFIIVMVCLIAKRPRTGSEERSARRQDYENQEIRRSYLNDGYSDQWSEGSTPPPEYKSHRRLPQLPPIPPSYSSGSKYGSSKYGSEGTIVNPNPSRTHGTQSSRHTSRTGTSRHNTHTSRNNPDTGTSRHGTVASRQNNETTSRHTSRHNTLASVHNTQSSRPNVSRNNDANVGTTTTQNTLHPTYSGRIERAADNNDLYFDSSTTINDYFRRRSAHSSTESQNEGGNEYDEQNRRNVERVNTLRSPRS